MTVILPTLPGYMDGVVGHDLLGYTIQCRECGRSATHLQPRLAIINAGDCRFHRDGWPDGTNPRLCRACRLARECPCHDCECERQGTYHPTPRRRQ